MRRVVARKGAYFVVDEAGSVLEGPFKTEAEALTRIPGQAPASEPVRSPTAPSWIGSRMAKIKLRAATAVQFDAGATAGAVRVGVWDQFTSWGEKTKEGDVTVFDETTLTQGVQNFARQSNDLYMDYDHQTAYVESNGKPAVALAWYCALAGVRGGKVFAFASHQDGIKPPDATGLADGLYGFRYQVTDLGQELLSGGKYKYLSPMFDPEGTDEQGNPIGYTFYCVAATNNPFQDGVEITFDKGRRMASTVPGSFKGEMQIGQRCSVTKRNGKYVEGTIRGINLNWGQALVEWDNPSAHNPWVPFSEFGAVVKLMAKRLGKYGSGKYACIHCGQRFAQLDDGKIPAHKDPAKGTACGGEGGHPGDAQYYAHSNKSASSAKKGKHMIKMDDGAFYKRLGLDDDSSPDAMKAAFKAYMARMDEETALKMADEDTMADDDSGAAAMADDGDADDKKKMTDPAGTIGIMADDDDKKKMDDSDGDTQYDDDTAMRKMAKDLGCAPKLSAIADAVKVLRYSHSPKTEVAKLSRRIADLEKSLTEAQAEKAKDAATKFARRAVTDGRWNPAEEAALTELRIESPKTAEKALQPKGTWTVLNRVTAGGEVLSKGRSEPTEFEGPQAESEIGEQVAVEARKYARENKVSLIEAYDRVATDKPQLYRRSTR